MRTKLVEKYQVEREDICKKIIAILDLDPENSFLLCELDNNVDKQTQLVELKPEIQKYFACSTISSFKPNFTCKRPYLNIIRSILRKQNYTIENTDHWLKHDNGLMKRTIKYKIFRHI